MRDPILIHLRIHINQERIDQNTDRNRNRQPLIIRPRDENLHQLTRRATYDLLTLPIGDLPIFKLVMVVMQVVQAPPLDTDLSIFIGPLGKQNLAPAGYVEAEEYEPA